VLSTGSEIVVSPAPIVRNGTTIVTEVPERVQQTRYICSGDTRQAVFTTNLGQKISDVEFCQFGCEIGRCRSTPVAQRPVEPVAVVDEDTQAMTNNSEGATFNRPSRGPAALDFDGFWNWLKNLFSLGPS
jgi:hypothetical protein